MHPRNPSFRRVATNLPIQALACCMLLLPANPRADDFVRIQDGGFTLEGRPFQMNGFNYFPPTLMRSDMSLWITDSAGASAIDSAFAKARDMGATTIRVVLDYGYSTNDSGAADYNDGSGDSLETVTYCRPTPRSLAALKRILAIADRNRLKVLVTLFEHMPGWAFVDEHPRYLGFAQSYLTGLLDSLKDDTRIAAWDLLNEPDIIAGRFSVPMAKYFSFFQSIRDTLKKMDPNHPVTIGFAKIDTVKRYADEVRKVCDFAAFHVIQEDQAGLGRKIDTLKNLLGNRPLVAEEIAYSSMMPNGITGQMATLGWYLDVILVEKRMQGALVWSLSDFTTPGTARTRGIPNDPVIEKAFGVLDTDLNGKGSDIVVRRFFTGLNRPAEALEFRYSKILAASPSESRPLGIAFKKIWFLRGDSTVIDSLQFGTAAACTSEGRGWYVDAGPVWGQWAGSLDSVSVLYHGVPQAAAFLRLELGLDPSMDSSILVMRWHDRCDSATIKKSLSAYTLSLSSPPCAIPVSGSGRRPRLAGQRPGGKPSGREFPDFTVTGRRLPIVRRGPMK